jgi:outer membrane protein insertion porin family
VRPATPSIDVTSDYAPAAAAPSNVLRGQNGFDAPAQYAPGQFPAGGAMPQGIPNTTRPQPQSVYANPPQGPMLGQPGAAPASGPGPAGFETLPAPPPGPGETPAFQPGADPFPGAITSPTLEAPPLDLILQPELEETMTGKVMLSVGVNSELGLVGSFVVDEQNFDWTRWPRGWEDLVSGQAFRGNGERFRFEAMPGTQLQRYSVSWTNPYMFNTGISETLSASYFDRKYTEWLERRAGGRVGFGYQLRPDLWANFMYRLEDVHISQPIAPIPELNEVLGANTLHGFRFQLTRDTRDNPFLATEGRLVELGFEQVVGDFVYPRADLDIRQFILMGQHPDGSGRRVLSLSGRAGWTGADTPIYERFFAGGFSTIRGFDFRGVSPISPLVAGRVPIGGNFSLLASAEYLFSITADDMLRGVVFCDTGTVEPSISDWSDRYRVAVGAGLRITIPAMGPAPIALDFSVPLVREPFDDTQVISFFVGFMR